MTTVDTGTNEVIKREPIPCPRGVQATVEEPDLLKKTEHVRRKGSSGWVGDPVNGPQTFRTVPDETIIEFVARTGLSVAQIRTMSREEISNFVATVTVEKPAPRQPWFQDTKGKCHAIA